MENKPDYFLIMNPGARGGRSRKLFKTIFNLLNKAGINYDYKITSSLKDAYGYSLEANQNNTNYILAVGGDGTINQVLNGFFEETGKKRSKSKFGIIYTGTSPDFCKSYSIPTNIHRAIRVLEKNKTKKIQIAKIQLSEKNLESATGKSLNLTRNTITRFFGCCANIGLGATLARYANGGIRKYLGNFAGTFLSLIITLLKYKANNYTVIIDGEKHILNKLYNISVGRTEYIASGIKVKHDLKEGDRKMYCLQVSDLNLFKIPALIKKVYSGKNFQNTNYLSLSYCRSIEVFGNYTNPEVEFDGDPVGYLPCKIEIASDPLEILVE